jgi:cell division transport system permease protein
VRNIFSITIICLSFLIVGVFLSLSNNLQHTAAELNRNLAVVFFLDRGLPDGERNALEQKIKASPFITGAVYISPEQALERFRKNFPELRDIVASLKTNPFPPSFEATLRDQATRSGQIQEFLRRMAGEKGVEDIQFNRDWVDKMQSLSRMVRAIGFFLGGILVSASFFIISNVIRLNVLARKDEILILRLVGATNNFIRVPFLMEGNPGKPAFPAPHFLPDQTLPPLSGKIAGRTPADHRLPLSDNLAMPAADRGRRLDRLSGEPEFPLSFPQDIS